MKIKYKQGRKFKEDRIFSIETKGEEIFTNARLMILINERDIIREPRTTHSTKPEIFYKMVDEICAGRKLDYFARKKRNGWDVYGDEVSTGNVGVSDDKGTPSFPVVPVEKTPTTTTP